MGNAAQAIVNPALSRPTFNREALAWRGHEISASVLPALGFKNWREFIDAAGGSPGGSVIDLGAGSSTVCFEALARGLRYKLVDACGYDVQGYTQNVWNRMNEVLGLMEDSAAGPFFGISELEFRARSGAIIEELNRVVRSCRAPADIARLSVSEGADLAIAHASLPKHSLSIDVFLREELPAMLSVAKRELRIAPFVWSDGGMHDQDLSHNSEVVRRVQGLAAQNNFSFEILPSMSLLHGQLGKNGSFAARFVRGALG